MDLATKLILKGERWRFGDFQSEKQVSASGYSDYLNSHVTAKQSRGPGGYSSESVSLFKVLSYLPSIGYVNCGLYAFVCLESRNIKSVEPSRYACALGYSDRACLCCATGIDWISQHSHRC